MLWKHQLLFTYLLLSQIQLLPSKRNSNFLNNYLSYPTVYMKRKINLWETNQNSNLTYFLPKEEKCAWI